MLPLDEYQRQVSARLLAPEPGSTRELEPGLALGPAHLRVHRNTILHTLVSALRLTFPTVARLTGEAFFLTVARQYIENNPPHSAVLYHYGRTFPEHLRSVAAEFACLFDIARFDLIINETGHQPAGLFGKPIPISHSSSVRLTKSLQCARFDYTVDSIRDAYSAGCPAHPGSEFFARPGRNLAVWRSRTGAAMKSLSDPAATFLEALILGLDAEAALAHAIEGEHVGQTVESIRSEVFASPFCRISTA